MPELLPWSSDLTRAAGGRLLAVLAGASWDRWTKALLETLDDPGVAVAAQDFSLVRVDSDLRPDVARRVAPSGSPTLAVLTPDGYPLAATTWAPPRTIREFLTSAAFQWKIRAPLVAEEAKRAQVTALEMGKLQPRKGQVNEAFVNACVDELVENCDVVFGGWDELPKRLNSVALSLLARRADLPAAWDALERTLDRICSSPMYLKCGAFCHASETQDWGAPDGLVFAEETFEMVEVMNFACGHNALPTYNLVAARGLRFLMSRESYSDPGLLSLDPSGAVLITSGTTASLFRTGSVDARDNDRAAVRSRRDPRTGLFGRSSASIAEFHLEDQVTALDSMAGSDEQALPPARYAGEPGQQGFAECLKSFFWDEAAGAFRDRHGPGIELSPLDTAQYPVEENAIAAGALARLGGEWLALAKRCLASFTDAYHGQGVRAARLALAVQDVLDAEKTQR